MLNKVILTGRLTATPELKTTTGGNSVTSFSIAVQRQFKSADGNYQTDFINIVAWRNTAEFITRYFEKGQLIAIVGSIQTRSYEDRNGQKRTAFEVVAEEAQFVESKKDSARSTEEFKVPPVTGGNDMQFEEVSDDELPF
ncbi:MAG: single-stranded DNA-binding protein [Clostridia bacterium]|nr:single-stranded DNA-binding protein [Clostridia bacterium]